jgi:multidrug efflux pump subunit AcrA (membrane-fusion protein)
MAACSRIRPSKPRSRRKRRVLSILVVTTAALVLGAFAFTKWRFSQVHETTDNAQVDGHITIISPRVQAFVAQVRVDDNQRVKQGDTLVVLDDRDLRVKEAQARADFASALAAAGPPAPARSTRRSSCSRTRVWSRPRRSRAGRSTRSPSPARRPSRSGPRAAGPGSRVTRTRRASRLARSCSS